MDGDMDMTRVNSAVRNPVSLDANARKGTSCQTGHRTPSGHAIASQEQSGSCLKPRLRPELRPAERPPCATPSCTARKPTANLGRLRRDGRHVAAIARAFRVLGRRCRSPVARCSGTRGLEGPTRSHTGHRRGHRGDDRPAATAKPAHRDPARRVPAPAAAWGPSGGGDLHARRQLRGRGSSWGLARPGAERDRDVQMEPHLPSRRALHRVGARDAALGARSRRKSP